MQQIIFAFRKDRNTNGAGYATKCNICKKPNLTKKDCYYRRSREDSEERNVEENAAEEQEKELGRGKRERRLSEKFEDYMFNYIFLTYKEAIERPEKDLWNKAIEEDKKSLK